MLTLIATYGIILLYYSLFLVAVYTSARCKSSNLEEVLTMKGEPGVLFSRLVAGVLFLGTGTVHVTLFRDINLEIFEWPVYDGSSVIWLALCGLAVITGTGSALKTISGYRNTAPGLPLHFSFSYTGLRILFLVVYEFFFRGVVLFITIGDAGIITAVIINLSLYVIIHWFHVKERYGSIPMGLILCSLAIYYQSVWPAIVVHAALALSHEITLLISYYSSAKKLRI